ncbi:exopolysaccharide biosynthesis polyprenyl glycosylphosphotransferase [Faecalibacter bovis]|uniref:Exopolysaccharide biosynthesis polyprenyl glycosylphosphotransferase n=1 Tax=Faecalibacter bovis TaxID=2898187 RepID=A0ABX7XFH8_9FLAO|nr:exopolysaccharide biosynthesis polyprenyl glycosylphosphotransferase [Faecalibacter bovis]QTV06685.1 exopolysaccharide biosynthesis polyprenyl glycosylphosphotransferase [Faecalibacter bovis]
MQRRKSLKIQFLQEFLDTFVLIVTFFLFLKIQYQFFWTESYPLEKIPSYLELFQSHYKALILFIFTWFIFAKNISLYDLTKSMKFVDILKNLIYHTSIFSIVVFAISGFKTSDLFSPQLAIVYVLTLFLIGLISRLYLFYYKQNLHINNKDISKVLVVDENDNTSKFEDLLDQRKDIGIRIIDRITENNLSFVEGKLCLNGVEFRNYIEEHDIEKIFISQKGKMASANVHAIINSAETNLIPVAYIPDSIYNGFTELKIIYIDTLPVFEIKRFPLDLKFNQIIKGIFDFIFAALVCIFLLSWLFPIISILIFLDSRGSILFIQKRNGLNGKEFNCYKFRTMFNSNLNSIKATERNDSRITRIGKFLRKTSLDELPQFLNVLKGDMSIVGPRPHMISQDHHYREIINKYNLRHYVKPGITGLSQVKGYRGAIDSDEDMENRIRTDIYYIRNWSYLLDIQIIYQTIVLILKGDENAI